MDLHLSANASHTGYVRRLWILPPHCLKGRIPHPRPLQIQYQLHSRGGIRNACGKGAWVRDASRLREGAAFRVGTDSERTIEVEATAHVARAHHWLSKWVRAKVRIRSWVEMRWFLRGF